jgi:outer membrane protein assembly factor BamB
MNTTMSKSVTPFIRLKSILSILSILSIVSISHADWLQYRGPNQDGISSETGLADAWPETGPEEIWRKPLGAGYSSITVADGKLYTMYSSDADEWVVCIKADTGDELWKQRTGKIFKDSFGDGPRSTPTIDNGKVYVVGTHGALMCLDAGTGGIVWQLDMVKEFGAVVPKWGISVSAVIDGQKLFVIAGGTDGKCVVALDKDTGKTIWTGLNDAASYSTPLLMEIGGVKQLACFTVKGVFGLARDDGRVLWEYPWTTKYDINATTPILDGNKLFIGSGYDSGSALIAISQEDGKWKAEEVWRSELMKNQFQSSVLIDGYLYGFHNKVMMCMKFDTGEAQWEERGLGHGCVLPADGKAIVLGEKSQLILAKIAPDGYQAISQANVLNGKTWTIPTIVDGRMYMRDEKEIVCVNIAK